MQSKKVLVIGVRIAAVCLLFAVCTIVGGQLSGLERVAQRGLAAQNPDTSHAAPTSPTSSPETQPGPGGLLVGFLAYSICAGMVVSYLILRSGWRGWTLAGAMAVGMYGISTVATQVDSILFLSNKLPHGMIQAIFVQGAITTALVAPLAVLVLGRWRASSPADEPPAPMRAASAAWKLPLLVLAFVFLYMFFGYYVAWQNPELRQYYGGTNWPTFFDSLKGNWLNAPLIYAVASFRALLYIGFMYPLIRMLRVSRWESAAATALFLSAWTTALLLPNVFMPASVARSHFRETLMFSLIFGALLGWLLSNSATAANRVAS